MDFLEQWVEYDFNPFIIFDSSSKVISLNKEAQFLLGEASKDQIFELAKLYASSTYGFKTTLHEMRFGSYNFFGFTVGYEKDDKIGIKLYRHPKQLFNEPKSNKAKVNIYTVLDLCISSTGTNSSADFIKNFDPTLPELWINVKDFVKLMTKVYNSYKDSATIVTKLKIKTGEYIKYGKKKHPILSLIISGDLQNKKFKNTILNFEQNSGTLVFFHEHETIIEMPLKTS